MKTKSKISGYVIRSAAYAVFLSLAFIAAGSAFQWPNKWYKSLVATVSYDSGVKSPSQPRAIGFAERVAYQRAIEDIYWRHRIWPKDNRDRKPSLDAVMSQAQLENKVRGYLHNSLVLQDYWQRPITAEQLQAEMDRMARDTKQPEVLRELFDALENDPAVIAECLARPILAERLIADFSAQDQTRNGESPQTKALSEILANTSAQLVYTLPEIVHTGESQCTDNWGATTIANAPSARWSHTAVWTGNEMIIWGGGWSTNTGGRYNPSTDSWTATNMSNAPSARSDHRAVWTGIEMIVWGGGLYPQNFLNTGGRYNPATDTWRATSMTNVPEPRRSLVAVWTGSQMIIWGGYDADRQTNTGGRYDPRTDSWTATSMTNVPMARSLHTAVWTGNEMIVWGGRHYDLTGAHDVNTGGRYNPATDNWIATNTINAPTAREQHTAIWTGTKMIVSGGWGQGSGTYDPSTDSWTATNVINAPSSRYAHTAVWTGSEMIVWGGLTFPGAGGLNTGGRYNPSTDSWTATNRTNAPTAGGYNTAVWTGSEMIVWGGEVNNRGTRTGGRYCGGPYPTPPPTAAPLMILQPNGAEVWLMGSMQEIKWEGANLTNSDRLIIQYSRDGGAGWFRIAQDVPALSLSYRWRVDNFPTTQGRVKILLQGRREITDQSDANFTVQRAPFITLLRPNGGEVFPIGLYRNIHWIRQNPGGNTVDIDYSIDNGTTWITIATQAEDTGWYFWHIPGPSTTTAKVRIRFHETPSLNDTSEAIFTIIE